MERIRIHKLIRSKRKTIALVIGSDATLTVRAPVHIPLNYIERLVNKKHLWIKRKISEIESRPKVRPKEFVNGEGFLYLGKVYRFKIVDSGIIFLGEDLFFPKSMLSNPAQYLKDWYKIQAAQKIQERVTWHAKEIGVNYKSINITDAQKRWGSCSQNGSLNFSWRLIMAPVQVVDYVVVHELAHIREKGHSQKFWNLIRMILPGYQENKKWLSENEMLLRI